MGASAMPWRSMKSRMTAVFDSSATPERIASRLPRASNHSPTARNPKIGKIILLVDQLPFYREPALPAERVPRFLALGAEGVGNVRQHVSVAAVPEVAIDVFRDLPGALLFAGGAQGQYVKAIEVQAFAAGTEEILPVGAFLHAEETALVDILAVVPGKDSGDCGSVGRKHGATDDPPESGVGVGTEVRPEGGAIHVIGDGSAGRLMLAE